LIHNHLLKNNKASIIFLLKSQEYNISFLIINVNNL